MVVLFVECCCVCGLKFNYLEVVVFIIVVLMEVVCDGRMVVEVMYYGMMLFMCDDVMDGVLEMIFDIQVEVIFFDGMKFVIVYYLIL